MDTMTSRMQGVVWRRCGKWLAAWKLHGGVASYFELPRTSSFRGILYLPMGTDSIPLQYVESITKHQVSSLVVIMLLNDRLYHRRPTIVDSRLGDRPTMQFAASCHWS